MAMAELGFDSEIHSHTHMSSSSSPGKFASLLCNLIFLTSDEHTVEFGGGATFEPACWFSLGNRLQKFGLFSSV